MEQRRLQEMRPSGSGPQQVPLSALQAVNGSRGRGCTAEAVRAPVTPEQLHLSVPSVPEHQEPCRSPARDTRSDAVSCCRCETKFLYTVPSAFPHPGVEHQILSLRPMEGGNKLSNPGLRVLLGHRALGTREAKGRRGNGPLGAPEATAMPGANRHIWRIASEWRCRSAP